jgi:hypothetical protein
MSHEYELEGLDLNEDNFPFTVELISIATGEVMWSQVIRGPGVLEIPKMSCRVNAKMTFPDGTTVASSDDKSVTAFAPDGTIIGELPC